MRKNFTKVAVLGLLLSPASLLAQDAASPTTNVASTNLAPIHSFLPNAYGKIDVRHYFHHKDLNDEKKLKYDPILQPRAVVGSKFFNDRLDSRFIFGVNNYTGTDHNSGIVTDRGTMFWNDFTAYKNTYFSLVPQLYFQFPQVTAEVRKPIKTELALDIPINFPIETGAGTLVLEAELTGKTYFSAGQDADDQVELRQRGSDKLYSGDEKGLSLTENRKKELNLTKSKDGSFKVNPSGRTFYSWFSYGATFKPSFVPGLEAQVQSIFETTYVPIMEVDPSSGRGASLRTTGGTFSRAAYTQKFEPSYLFGLKYAFTPEYSITNEFTLMNVSEGQRRYSNMVSLVAKLF